MALRVLLADESVTIKKVIQLALQDFAVEVKAVPVGLDVLEVSKSFQPDLVFADILLQKRSGYEVCADLKKDTTTAAIPVVLMWSSFMELDQRQVDACGADGRLEKPFEVEALRKLVLELVPRTRSQRMAHFLEYPATLAAPLKQEIKPPPPPQAKSPLSPAATKQVVAQLLNEVTPTAKIEVPAAMRGPARPKPSEPPQPAADMSTEFTHTPGIPDRPTSAESTKSDYAPPLGALPDLQLEGLAGAPTANTNPGAGWNMESFEPLNLDSLALTDDEEEIENFKPLQLPQAEPTAAAIPSANIPELSLADDEDDAEADRWANRSLDKYRLAPLKPEESLALDDLNADFASAHEPVAAPKSEPGKFEFNQSDMPELTTDKTEIIAPTPPRKHAPPPAVASDEEAIAEFSMSEDDFNRTSRLEIESVVHKEKTRPSIVRELLRDPDFTAGGKTVARAEATYDLSSEGKPAGEEIDSRRMEELVRSQLTPQLEKVIERVIEKTVAQLLPQIAERIVKKELERLLDET